MIINLFILTLIILFTSLSGEIITIIPSGITITDTIDLLEVGENLIIEKNNFVVVNGIGVYMQNDNQVVLNKGLISTDNNINSHGIFRAF